MTLPNGKKVVLITTGQPSLNPRLVKEADSLAGAGYQVTVIYAYWNSWGDNLNKKILPQKKWEAICAGGHPVENPIPYLMSRLMLKAARLIGGRFGLKKHLEAIGIARSSFYLEREASKHNANIYIGHNLGAIAATVKAAKKHQAKCGFDAEDFHRQEVTDDVSSAHFKLVKTLEDKYLSCLGYMTASSPQISDAYTRLYPDLAPITLLNVFSKSANFHTRKINSSGPIKIFWFSQTIGANRGLEHIAQALKAMDTGNFELHLLGYLDNKYKAEFIHDVLLNFDKVFFYPPIPPDEIISFATQFDIGLAAELSTPLNRDICLTNKLFTYLQAGLAVIASDTMAQKQFLSENPSAGRCYERANPRSLISILSAYHSDRKLLFAACKAALMLGQEKYNWETEGAKFLSLISKTLHSN